MILFDFFWGQVSNWGAKKIKFKTGGLLQAQITQMGKAELMTTPALLLCLLYTPKTVHSATCSSWNREREDGVRTPPPPQFQAAENF